ncbi:MAG: DNA cytosine methyltransferase [Verrucomicrobium sp.]|nr:DNA cytosine methyltransferase [Verrucomicrobium sp.]
MNIPVIDLFAGPGGLGEGFSSYSKVGSHPFHIRLSIEMEEWAHSTLSLRAFYRAFTRRKPDDYYRMIRGEISLENLYEAWPFQRQQAEEEAWRATLGITPAGEVHRRIAAALNGAKDWVLVGGPPCQAYSTIGRARNRGIKKTDVRVGLYREYLGIVARFRPSVFVMENVKGLLSADIDGSIFQRILEDLRDPGGATGIIGGKRYRIFSFSKEARSRPSGKSPEFKAADYIIECENYGIPQMRHRVILLGIREDLDVDQPSILLKSSKPCSISQVLQGLPRLRSGLSQSGEDNFEKWVTAVRGIRTHLSSIKRRGGEKLAETIEESLDGINRPQKDRGGEFVACRPYTLHSEATWFIDPHMGGVANHSSRAHIESDLHRYLFSSCHAKSEGVSPNLQKFPDELLPDHANIFDQNKERFFNDRFRANPASQPCRTITSHIAKDGHYYIHYDPTQCRSFTVREAARIQTFPDNYFFCGSRTAQYRQVGNAVPPLLARKLANVVWKIMAGKR